MVIPITTPWSSLPKEKPEVDRVVCAIDPGIKTFVTAYTFKETYSFAFGKAGFGRIFSLAQRCDKLKSAYAKERRRRGKSHLFLFHPPLY